MGIEASAKTQVWAGTPSRRVLERVLVYFFTGFYALGIILLIIADLIYFSDPIISTLLLVLGPLSSLLVLVIGAVRLRGVGKVRYELNDSEVIFNSSRISRSEIKRIEVKKSVFDLTSLKTGTIVFYDTNDNKLPVQFSHIKDVERVARLINK